MFFLEKRVRDLFPYLGILLDEDVNNVLGRNPDTDLILSVQKKNVKATTATVENFQQLLDLSFIDTNIFNIIILSNFLLTNQ